MLPRDIYSKSWVITEKSTGEVVGEFYLESLVEMFDEEKVIIETAYQYLTRINKEIKNV